MKKVLFLYTELAGYVVSCMKKAAQSGMEVHVVRWPVKSEAPFDFGSDLNIRLYDRSNYNNTELLSLAEKIRPDVLLCSGWVDKDYLSVCKKYFGKKNTVLLLDNPWQGNFRQRLATLYGKLLLTKIFSHAWVPGEKQRNFARKLGFKEDHVHTGFYCADLPLFDQVWNIRSTKSTRAKEFLYVGRYADFKGIRDLWDAFLTIPLEKRADWKLKCLGTGDLWNARVMDQAIEHIGFVQPADMIPHLTNASIFVLPSHREPWGVVVHEMAACGMPMICSDAIGAAEAFVDDHVNGAIFRAGNKAELKSALEYMMLRSEEQYRQMAMASRAASNKINQAQWAETLEKLAN